MNNKIADLKKCIVRVARHGGHYAAAITHHPMDLSVSGYRHRATVCRFVALWQARNRRTRVLMYRQREAARG